MVAADDVVPSSTRDLCPLQPSCRLRRTWRREPAPPLLPLPQMRNAECGCGMRNEQEGSSRTSPTLEDRRSIRIPHSTFHIVITGASTALSARTFPDDLRENRDRRLPVLQGTLLANENAAPDAQLSRHAHAVSTSTGSTAPVEQAEPEEQAIPARSSASAALASVPGSTRRTCGARRLCAALITASGTTRAVGVEAVAQRRQAARRTPPVRARRASRAARAHDPRYVLRPGGSRTADRRRG